MNPMTPTKRKVEYYAELPGGDVQVSVHYHEDGDAYVSADWLDEQGRFARLIVAETICEPCNELDAIRSAFCVIRGKVRAWARSWQEHRSWAAREKGGKRGYYTKHANEARKLAIKFGADWKLCKQIWKEITKL